VFIPVKKIIYITSSVLLTSGITSCLATESPAASLVKSLVSTAGAELGGDAEAGKVQENADTPQTAVETEQPTPEAEQPVDANVATVNEVTEVAEVNDVTQQAAILPEVTAENVVDATQQGVSEVAAQGENLEQRHLVSQSGEAYLSPKTFPRALPDGWYFVTKDLATLKEKLATAKPQIDDHDNQVAPVAVGWQRVPVDQGLDEQVAEQVAPDAQQFNQQLTVNQTPQVAAATQQNGANSRGRGFGNHQSSQRVNAQGGRNVQGATGNAATPQVNAAATPPNGDATTPLNSNSKTPIMFQCFLA
jgi:hypothetical protein